MEPLPGVHPYLLGRIPSPMQEDKVQRYEWRTFSVDNPAAIDPRLLLLVRPTFDNYNVQQPTLCWENRNTVLVSMGSAVKPIVSHQTCWPRPPTYPVQASSFASSTNSHRQPLSRCMYDEDTQYIDPEVADSIEKDTERPVSYSVPSSPASSGEW
eukprot:CAMPEP_0184649596 /NCGR_PEP_ID=MMETSP0308-20130426/7001_1 /TAXON_ID=38269 /ORGANISM="Gloeochaete witrockiana, Strain SAG 46.84" /LENGTH=154 /DNA_ID=CAMNT_0027082455 /DNA_START=378 /DNA_END=839 /DNA_ORIENTATION=+